MQPWEKFFREKQIERTIKALKNNRFEALFVEDSKTALEEVIKRIPDGATISIGGSVTLAQVGILEALKGRNIHLILPFQQAKDEEERMELIRKTFYSDFFLTGTNAITEDGKLFNIDASGNRVGAMLIGPKQVIVVAGVNKIVKDLKEAERRVKEWTAPQNAKRLGRKTPCTETGLCSDCNASDRICNIYVTLVKKPARNNILVIIVGESLGI
ncbi:MAG: lactate utilization protein [Thermodesulfobacteriota bacterium]